MTNMHVGVVALDFSNRESARTCEFSRIWNKELHAVFSDVAPYYDVASNFASLGLCNRWRQKFISMIDLKPGYRTLDVCAGTNAVGIALLRRQPDLQAFAIDRSKAMQDVGRRLARAAGFQINELIGDAHRLPYPDNHFDVVTLQFASRHLRVVDVFSEVRRVLKPGGCFYHCDMLRPESKTVEALYGAYLKACVLTTAFVFRSGPEARSCSDYFVRAIQLFYTPRELTELLEQVGFRDVSSVAAPGQIVGAHKAVKA